MSGPLGTSWSGTVSSPCTSGQACGMGASSSPAAKAQSPQKML